MLYARVRPDLVTGTRATPWAELGLTDLYGEELGYAPNAEWVKCLFCCINTGLAVLTDDDDGAFVVPSIDLEYAEEIPNA